MTYSPIPPPSQVPGSVPAPSTPTPTPPPIPLPASFMNGTQEHPPSSLSPAPQFTPGQLHLSEGDIQQTGRFVREFAVMSLLPWMEKCVIDWNEVVRTS